MRLRAADLWFVLLLAAPCACGGGAGGDEEERVQPEVEVVTAVVTERSMTATIGALGTVTARAGHVAALGAPGLTRVTAVHVAAGQHVARGAVLIQLDGATFAAARQGAEAQLQAAERSVARAQRLTDQGIVARRELDQAQSELAQARANAIAARRMSDLATLRAPIAGVITRLDAPLGATVDAGQPLVEIADPTQLDVVLGVTPDDAARAHAGATVVLFPGSGPGADTVATGRVVDVSGTVDSASRSVAVRVAVVKSQRPLRIGESVFGQVAAGTTLHALVIPVTALVPSGEGYRVFVVDSSGMGHAREVELGIRVDSVVQVTRGLVVGEQVVTDGAYGMDDSVKVVRRGRRPAPAEKP